jgi:protein disulfide-isomerase A1
MLLMNLPATLLVLLTSTWEASALEVQHLSSAQFKDAVRTNDFVLASFQAPGISLGSSFEREYEEAARELKSPLVVIDCEKETDLCRDYDVSSYPAIRFFNGLDTSVRYRGGRKASE